MKQRIYSSIIIVAIMLVAFISRIFTPYVFDLFIGVTGIIACVEMARCYERARKFSNIIIIGTIVPLYFIAIIITMITKGSVLMLLLNLAIIIVLLFILGFLGNLIFQKNTKAEMEKRAVEGKVVTYSFEKSINTLMISIYPSLLIAIQFIINHLNDFAFTADIPMIFVMFALLLIYTVTVCTDTFAFIVGCSLKGPKLCPLISPKKTISGAIGGLVFGTLGGVLLCVIFYNASDVFFNFISTTYLNTWHILLVSVIASIATQCGDLLASYIKRRSRIKDYGTLFPGHGGVMDRIDGLVFSGLVVGIALLIALNL